VGPSFVSCVRWFYFCLIGCAILIYAKKQHNPSAQPTSQPSTQRTVQPMIQPSAQPPRQPVVIQVHNRRFNKYSNCQRLKPTGHSSAQPTSRPTNVLNEAVWKVLNGSFGRTTHSSQEYEVNINV
jgi:hypothetical protein